MRGRKYDDEIKEQALALLITDANITDVSRDLSIPRQTLVDWKAAAIASGDNEQLKELRKRKKEDFVKNAWLILDKALKLADRRISTALNQEDQITVLIEGVQLDGEINEATKQSLITKLRALQIQSVRDLSTLIGTMFDKQALASGDETERFEVNLTFEAMQRELKQLSGNDQEDQE